MTESANQPHGSQLFLGDKLVWENPSSLGHFGIKIRKQRAELELAERIHQERMKLSPQEREAKRRELFIKYGIEYPEFDSNTC